LSLERYRAEIDAIEAIWQKQFGTATLLMTSRSTLLERFFDSIASRVRRSLPRRERRRRSLAEGDHGAARTQIRQHKEQLRHRQASIQRIHDATDSLEQKIAAFEQASQANSRRSRRA
jgi:vacuolar-type H+-ATPase subunit I/STV1